MGIFHCQYPIFLRQSSVFRDLGFYKAAIFIRLLVFNCLPSINVNEGVWGKHSCLGGYFLRIFRCVLVPVLYMGQIISRPHFHNLFSVSIFGTQWSQTFKELLPLYGLLNLWQNTMIADITWLDYLLGSKVIIN